MDNTVQRGRWRGRDFGCEESATFSNTGISLKLSKPSCKTSSQFFVPIFAVSVLVLILAFSVQSAEAGYPEQFLESVEVCATGSFGPFGLLSRKKIRLVNFPNNTVSVKITRWDDLYASFFNYRCRFQVTAPKNMGVMVVIQSMKLRTRKKISCRDYVQFQQGDGYKTSQICGEVDKSDVAKIPEKIIGPRKFYDPKGEMEVTFFTDARDEVPDGDDAIALHLVFTAYKECTPAAVSTNQIRQCSSLRSHSCIASNLFCDGVINCGFNDEDFGADEKNCDGLKSSRDMNDVDKSISLYVFAITTVATLVIVVIFSLIVCCCLRKFSKQRRDHARNHVPRGYGPSASNSPLHHLHHHHSQHSGIGPDVIRMDITGPTAPLRGVEPSPEKYPVVDMDQPPPYDALFPTTKPSAPQLTTKPSKKQ